MRVLIDVGHPSDVHLFRNFSKEFINKGHDVLFTARNKEVTYQLLNSFGLNYIPYGNPYKSIIGKVWGMVKFEYSLFRMSRKFKPDIFFCHGSFYAAHVAFLLRKPFITFEDTGNMEQIMLFKPFSDVILTPDTFSKDFGNKHIRFQGTKELAYLHPNQYKPYPGVLNEIGLKEGEKFIILRFVAWNASHDIGHRGISYKNKVIIINELSRYAKIFISSEAELPEDMAHLKLNIPPEKIIDLMYYADLFYGESATMASECALLGTPAIFVNNAKISYTKEQETKYDLVYNFSESEEDQEKSIQKAKELIKKTDLKASWKEKNKKMLSEQIDLTSFMVWFIENYPDSEKIMKENPEYQDRFMS